MPRWRAQVASVCRHPSCRGWRKFAIGIGAWCRWKRLTHESRRLSMSCQVRYVAPSCGAASKHGGGLWNNRQSWKWRRMKVKWKWNGVKCKKQRCWIFRCEIFPPDWFCHWDSTSKTCCKMYIPNQMDIIDRLELYAFLLINLNLFFVVSSSFQNT